MLKLCVKRKIEDLISKGAVNANEDVEIFIYIDEQLTATNGYYNLQDSIVEELKYGIVNFNYGIVHPHVFNEKVIVHIQYCATNYTIVRFAISAFPKTVVPQCFCDFRISRFFKFAANLPPTYHQIVANSTTLPNK